MSPSAIDGNFDPQGCLQPLLDDFEKDIRGQLWQGAAARPQGEGLEVGADVWQMRAEQRRFEKRGMLDHIGLNMTVVAGGQWNDTREAEQGYLLENKLCDIC